MAGDVVVATVAPRLTAVVAETTTWEAFQSLWAALLDEVYTVVYTFHPWADATWQTGAINMVAEARTLGRAGRASKSRWQRPETSPRPRQRAR